MAAAQRPGHLWDMQLLTSCATGLGGLSPVLQVDLEQVQAGTPMFRACREPINLHKDGFCLTGTPTYPKRILVKGKGKTGEGLPPCAVMPQWCGMASLSSSQVYISVLEPEVRTITIISQSARKWFAGILGIMGCLGVPIIPWVIYRLF